VANVSIYPVDGMVYLPHPDHRNASPTKSQWTITVQEELMAFQLSHARRWLNAGVGWGLHLVDGQPAYLGVLRDTQSRAFLAKFVGSETQPVWHGYPADHCRTHDQPAVAVLDDWLRSRLLKRQIIRKISKGQPCKLSS
jgi:hypothetical protein